ncbi:MAG: hypothetical protein A3F74_13135 [Betaproteobacteria bacterium RIFCSPLOWO2_12_FULL_62_58]|nr:MAG: hypothetical protein A3F74_13135 [Betaproteobacteria bacterium RIFCSPLOWO2_12_FULL_62_58]
MELDKLVGASCVLSELSVALASMPDEAEKSAIAAISITIANLYLIELAKHLGAGMEPYDAMVATARGDMGIPESKATLLRVLTERPTKD